MNSTTQPVAKPPPSADGSRSAQEWLDALAAGTVGDRVFFSGISDLLRRSPDAGWELLALVDQYYRRGKIGGDVFSTLKQHLQGVLIGKGTGEVSLPPQALTPVAAPELALAPTTEIRAEPPVAPQIDAALESAPRALATGDLLRGRYEVLGILGRGGMGTVFAANDRYRLDAADGEQRIAIKVLHTEIIQRPHLFAELRREFQHLQSLSHPNIVRVHEFDRDGALAFFTMEYLSGALLARVLANSTSTRLDRGSAQAIVRDVGAAVAHAHSRGVVHGDLNPGNIFITDRGEVRVLDFGASHRLHRAPWISDFERQDVAVATPSFASCQVLEGEVADARDDVYALACVAYVLLSGEHPFGGATALKARTSRLKPARPPHLPRTQWRALVAGLRFERERRPADVAAWIASLDLRDAARALPPLDQLNVRRAPRRSGWAWAVAGSMAVLAALAWVVAENPRLLDGAPATPQLQPEPRAAATAGIPGAQPPPAPSPPALAPAAAPPRAESNPVPAPPPVASSVVHPLARPAASPVAAAGVPPSVRARLELAADNVDVPPAATEARIVVRRSRSLRDEVSFRWWTESGTAKPGLDFVAVKPRTERLDPGQASFTLVVPVSADPARRQPRSFYVVIDDDGESAAIGPRTLTQITIAGND